jgi:hypothetical protein
VNTAGHGRRAISAQSARFPQVGCSRLQPRIRNIRCHSVRPGRPGQSPSCRRHPGVAVRYTGVIRDAMGWEGGRVQDGSGIADGSEVGPCASFAMDGRFVT